MKRDRPYQPRSQVKAQIVLDLEYKNPFGEARAKTLNFQGISDFSNYLRWEPHVGMMIGYKPKNGQSFPVTVSIASVRLAIRYGPHVSSMKTERRFLDVFEFAAFLKEESDIASALGGY